MTHYWLLDPHNEILTVLQWTSQGYLVALVAGRGDKVRAPPFDAVALDVSELLDEARGARRAGGGRLGPSRRWQRRPRRGHRAKPLIDATNGAARVRAVSDQERKGKSSERDEDEASASDERSEEQEAEGSDEGSDESDETEDEGSEETEDETSEEEEESSEEPDGEENARAQRVAAALGVGSAPDETEAGEGEEAAPAPNRAARRAEAAQRRKKRKTATDATAARSADDEPDEALPKDKNARAKELLKRRRDQASEGSGEKGTRPIQLLPGEMVDDALARSSSAVSKWIRENFGIIQWVILGSLAAGGGYLFYQSRLDTTVANASGDLMAGDPRRPRPRRRRGQALGRGEGGGSHQGLQDRGRAQRRGAGQLPEGGGRARRGTNAATLARLGEAGDYLDKREWDKALEGYSAVASSPLAGADPDVKVRALEGLGFAKEGKGDLDGALAAFKEIEGIDGRGNKELGLYHQGRVWLARGDKDKAKDLLKQAHDKLEQPSTEGTALRYLQQMTDEDLRRIDPSLVPEKAPLIGGPKGGSMSPDEIDKLRRKYEEMMKNKGEHR